MQEEIRDLLSSVVGTNSTQRIKEFLSSYFFPHHHALSFYGVTMENGSVNKFDFSFTTH
jgi:hypothetical protein